MRRLLILMAALVLLTTACKIEINAELEIMADKSGNVIVEFGFDDEVAALAEANGSSPESMLGDFDLEDIPGAEQTTEQRGDMTFTIIKVPVEDFTEDEGMAGDLTEGLTDDFTIVFTEDRVTIDGSTTLDDAVGDGDELGISPEMMAEFFSINIKVTMPGKILSHNATSQSGNTLTWVVDLTAGTLDIQAESDPNASSDDSSLVLYLLIGAAVILAAVLAWLWMKKRGETAPAADAAPPAPPTEDAAPAAPPPAE